MTGFTNTPGWVAQTQNDTKSTHLSDNNQAEPQGKPQGMSDTVKKRGFMRYPAKYLGKNRCERFRGSGCGSIISTLI